MRKRERNLQKLDFSFSSERECGFSLDFRTIRPLEFFGTRTKVALRGKAYLSFRLCLSVL